jgi:hypothetical protein
MLAPNMPRRHRQIGLDAKGNSTVPEPGIFFFTFSFFFSLSVYLCCSLFDCPPSLPVDFFGSLFIFIFHFSSFFIFFFFLLLTWFC